MGSLGNGSRSHKHVGNIPIYYSPGYSAGVTRTELNDRCNEPLMLRWSRRNQAAIVAYNGQALYLAGLHGSRIDSRLCLIVLCNSAIFRRGPDHRTDSWQSVAG